MSLVHGDLEFFSFPYLSGPFLRIAIKIEHETVVIGFCGLFVAAVDVGPDGRTRAG